MPTDRSKKDAEAICQEARERFTYVQEVDNENRKNARDDIAFVWEKGAQWPQAARQERDADHRPWLEINQLPQFIKQVVNDQRQNRPAIKIRPAADNASEDTADILEGLVRHIEQDSRAGTAYDSGLEYAVTGGRGYWRVVSDYETDDSFDQKLLIHRISDPETVYLDPDYHHADGSDIRYGFVTEWVRKEDWDRKYPDADPIDWDESDTNWIRDGKEVMIADYYRRIYEEKTLVLLADGTKAWKEDLTDEQKAEGNILREREAERITVEWFKLGGGTQILEEYDWPGRLIPVVMCVGDEVTIKGKRVFQGLIRRARDVQMMYNYWQTQATELIALAPKAPWLVTAEQIEGYEDRWAQANNKAFPYLPYNDVNGAGGRLPPPVRNQFAQVPTGIVEQANKCQQDLQQVLGLFKPSLGEASSPDQSGRAIMALQNEGDVGTFHFRDNLSRAIELTGNILLELIPHYYDTQRIVRTVDEDGEQKMQTVNQMDVLTAISKNDLSVGRFAVAVDVGPSYKTKRIEAVASMLDFMKVYPPAAAAMGDLIAKNQDWPGNEDLSERLLAIAPPPIQQLAASKKQGGQPPDPQTMAQLNQMHQQLQQAQQGMQQLSQENQQLKSGQQVKMQEAQMNASIEQQKMQFEQRMSTMKASQDMALAEFKAKLDQDTKLRVAEIQANASIMSKGMEAAMMPVPDSLPGEGAAQSPSGT